MNPEQGIYFFLRNLRALRVSDLAEFVFNNQSSLDFLQIDPSVFEKYNCTGVIDFSTVLHIVRRVNDYLDVANPDRYRPYEHFQLNFERELEDFQLM